MKHRLTLIVVAAATVLLRHDSVCGATFNIANGDVAGPNGLTAAITASNTNAQDDTIELALNGTYTLTNVTGSLPQIGPDAGHKLTIHGNGAILQRDTMVAPAFRIFTIQSGTNVAISGLTMANGLTSGHGGAIYVNTGETAASTLTIENCIFNSNQGDYGGAIFNDGFNDPSFPGHYATLMVTNSTFNNNFGSQHGGAIWNESGGIVMNVSNCTFNQNVAAGQAGAIQFDGSNGDATGSISNCTFSLNTARSQGGAVNVDGFNGSAQLAITNCTFDHNSASQQNLAKGWGGGLALDGSSSGNAVVNVSNCTFNGNSAKILGGGIYLSETTSGTTVLHIGNTILKAGATGANLALDNITGGTVTVTSHGYNLSSDSGAGVLTATGDQISTDPLLDPAGLKDNGGLTQTLALRASSPALDQGKSNTISSSNNDQRAEPRPFDDPFVTNASGGDASDIGAYEADVRLISEQRVPGTNDLRFTFMTILDHTYEVQGRASLGPGTWAAVTSIPAAPITGTGGGVQVTIPNAIGAPGTGFYRAHQLP